MKKIFIPILALLLLPLMASAAATDVTFGGTEISVAGVTLVVTDGYTDQIVVDASSATFTLSADSDFNIRSYGRNDMSASLGFDVICGSSYSEINVSGNSLGSTLVVSPGSGTCSGAVGGGGGGTITTTEDTTTEDTTAAEPVDVPTTTTGEVTATPSAGAETTITTTEDTTAKVALPVDAVSVETEVKIEPETKETVTASRATPASRNVVGGYVYNYTAVAGGETVSSFNKSATLTFTYTDEQISGLKESTLKIFYWKETTSQWVAIPTTVDAENNTLTASTNHFTYFAVMGLSEDADEDEITTEAAIADGAIIRNPNAAGDAQFDIYIVKLVGSKMFKRLILSPHVFESYGHLQWEDVQDVDQATMDQYTTSNLVRADGDYKVYELTPDGDTGTKKWLSITVAEFEAQGYDWDSIYTINTTDRDAYNTA